ncbi:MAG: hypothetical protein GF308_01730 [Candidatus Heimdallarchaeota archaeon]|nr:hypothetical protein [Candidatus Heimdallarchaeota archaeon]
MMEEKKKEPDKTKVVLAFTGGLILLIFGLTTVILAFALGLTGVTEKANLFMILFIVSIIFFGIGTPLIIYSTRNVIGKISNNKVSNFKTATQNLPSKRRRQSQIIILEGEIKNKTCMICKEPIKTAESILQCANCHSFFHREHLLEWLKRNNYCPYCKKRIF